MASAALAAISSLIHVFMLPPLLWYCTRIAHYLAENFVLLPDKGVELPGVHRHRFAAELLEAVSHVGRVQRAIDFGIQLGDDVARRFCRREQAHPEIEFTAREPRLGDGRDVRQRGDAGRRADGEREQL